LGRRRDIIGSVKKCYYIFWGERTITKKTSMQFAFDKERQKNFHENLSKKTITEKGDKILKGDRVPFEQATIQVFQ
jgi:hypothetical protein